MLVPPSTLIPVELEAPRDAIAPAQVFALRYFMRDGARRAIVRCSEARPWPGMRDIVVGRLLAEPVPAPERVAPRRSLAVRLSGSVVQCVNLRPGTPVAIQVTDVSESGIGFVSPAPFSDGDRVILDAPANGGTPDAELEIVRRDLAAPRASAVASPTRTTGGRSPPSSCAARGRLRSRPRRARRSRSRQRRDAAW